MLLKCQVRGQRDQGSLWERGSWWPWCEEPAEWWGQKSRLERWRHNGKRGSGDSGYWHTYQEVLLCLRSMYLSLSWSRSLKKPITVYTFLLSRQVNTSDAWSQFECHIFKASPGWHNGCKKLEWMLGIGLVLLSPQAWITSGKLLPTRLTSPANHHNRRAKYMVSLKAISKSWLLNDKKAI